MGTRVWVAGLLTLAGAAVRLLLQRRRRAAEPPGAPPPPPGTAGDREPRRPRPTAGAGAVEAPLP